MKIGDKVKYKSIIGEIIETKKDIFNDDVFCVLLENGQKVWSYDGFLKLKKIQKVNWNKEAQKEKYNQIDLNKKVESFCNSLKGE